MLPAFIETIEKRKLNENVSLLLIGASGVGKTSQIKKLKEAGFNPLVIDGEAGLLSVKDVEFDSINIRSTALKCGITPWQLIRNIAVLFAGANPASRPDELYGKSHYELSKRLLGDVELYDKYDCLFFDSLSEFARDAFAWSLQQKECVTSNGSTDTRKAYGICAEELINLMRQLQHVSKKDVILSGGLIEEVVGLDTKYKMLLIGNKAPLEIPYIFDQVCTMISGKNDDGETKRVFITNQANEFGYPAKDRSGKLDELEPANIATVINKIKGINQ